MANGNNSFWTDENKAIVKELYIDQNKSSAIVGAHLGVSRNAVIGIINRMGFKKDIPRPLKDKKAQKKVYRRARTAADRVQRRAEGPVLTVIRGEDVHLPLLASVKDLRDGLCAYPYGSHDFQFCGRPRGRGAFCHTHADICYNDPLAYRRR